MIYLQYIKNFGGNVETLYDILEVSRKASKEVIEKAKEVTQKDIKVVEESRRSGDPAVLIASSDKAKTVLGWKPEYDDLGTIIKTAWEWHSTHPNGYSK